MNSPPETPSRAPCSACGMCGTRPTSTRNQAPRKFHASVRMRAQGITDPPCQARADHRAVRHVFPQCLPPHDQEAGHRLYPGRDHLFHPALGQRDVAGAFWPDAGLARRPHHWSLHRDGTVITRVLQSGGVAPGELEHKFRDGIHANTIVFLTYSIAALNIEAVYQGIPKNHEYLPCEGICLTHTFQMYEGDDKLALYMPDTFARRKRKKEVDIRVTVGTPPYSPMQNSANMRYPSLDEKIRGTCATRSNHTPVINLYDSYIRAIRWSSDPSGYAGILATSATRDGSMARRRIGCASGSWKSSPTFTIFHLCGNRCTSQERARKEGVKIFGSGRRAPSPSACSSIPPTRQNMAVSFFHDIGDHLDQNRSCRSSATSGQRTPSAT